MTVADLDAVRFLRQYLLDLEGAARERWEAGVDGLSTTFENSLAHVKERIEARYEPHGAGSCDKALVVAHGFTGSVVLRHAGGAASGAHPGLTGAREAHAHVYEHVDYYEPVDYAPVDAVAAVSAPARW